MIKKVDISLLGRAQGTKTPDFGAISRLKPLFCQDAHRTPTKPAKKVYFGVLQHPSVFQAKLLTGKFYLGIKSKYPLSH